MTNLEYFLALAETCQMNIIKTIIVGDEVFGFTKEHSKCSVGVYSLESYLYNEGKLSPFSIVFQDNREYLADQF